MGISHFPKFPPQFFPYVYPFWGSMNRKNSTKINNMRSKYFGFPLKYFVKSHILHGQKSTLTWKKWKLQNCSPVGRAFFCHLKSLFLVFPSIASFIRKGPCGFMIFIVMINMRFFVLKSASAEVISNDAKDWPPLPNNPQTPTYPTYRTNLHC